MSERDRKEFLWMLFLVGLVMLALSVMDNATTLARLKFDELVTTANAIARVHCMRADTHWRSGEIWTRNDFLVVVTNKGSLPRIVEVEMPGGIVGHLHSRVEEVPSFAPGEEAYLFLWISPDGTFRILGWSQGSFRIRKDSSTGLETVTEDSASASIFDPVSRQFRHGAVRKLPLAVFEVKVKRAMATH